MSAHQKFCAECGHALDPPTAIDPQLDTQPIETTITDPDRGDDPAPPSAIATELDTEPIDAIPAPGFDAATAPTAESPALNTEAGELPEPEPDVWIDTTPTTPVVTAHDISWPPGPGGPTTDEMPALFDGRDEFADYPTPREPFRLRVILLLALFSVGAMLMSIAADVIDIRTTRPTSGIATGIRTLDDLGSNLGLAGFVGVAVMVIGSLLACFGLRWGAGLAGGAGMALVGWAGLVIGLAEHPIAIAESVTRTSTESFTLRITRDLGWWLTASVGILGALVFLGSLRWIGSGGRRALNPVIAAFTAVAMAVLAAGPLVPVGTSAFADNFRSTDPNRDLPTAFFAGRLGQVALIAVAGVIGMLIVRSYGLGLAAGSVSVGTWLWLSSLADMGTTPIGIAVRNPSATDWIVTSAVDDDTVPHAVTTVGMVATLVLLLVAAALATYRLNRPHTAVTSGV